MLVCCFNRDTFDANSNQLTGHRVGTSGSYTSLWAYDYAGNQLQKETNTWTYGGDNRVRRLTRSSGFYYENWYDTNGQRVAKSSTTTDWHFLYGQSGELLSETKNGPHVKSYIWLEGELVALVYNDELYFVHNDHLGRPHKVTDDTKAVVWEADLQSFDRSVISTSIGALNIGFPGQYWDSESGTWQNWHRDYDPSTGRYIQSDPIGLSGGMNTYAYVLSNPLLHTDILGLDTDINMIPKTQMELWRAVFRNIPNDPNVFSIAGHGNPTSMFNQYGNPITPNELADMMEKQGYDGKQPVKLYSCETGSNGTNSFAQKLANLINQPVTAPSVPYLVNTNGWQGLQSGGEWVIFRPQNGGN